MAKQVNHLPLQTLGFSHTPAVPYWPSLWRILDTLLRLGVRALETEPAKRGLSNTYTIDHQTATAHEFLFGTASSLADTIRAFLARVEAEGEDVLRALEQGGVLSGQQDGAAGASAPGPLTGLSLDQPEQFTLSWTTYEDVYARAEPLIPVFSAMLTDPVKATELFWPSIASFGLAYNLLFLRKVGVGQADTLKTTFGDAWSSMGMEDRLGAGQHYVIDLTIFDALRPVTVKGFPRVTPSTITFLRQDPQTKALSPTLIRVADPSGAGNAQYYTPDSPAWLYALQAARTSTTVYGIWLGHVWHWHIVTAAMQMTFYNTVPTEHPLWPLIASQANFCIEFDEVLLLLWSQIAPPTSVSEPLEFISLIDRFATGRRFFDDDPPATLRALGLEEADFTVHQPWDAYPVVGYLLDVWSYAQTYVSAFVDVTYRTDQDVAGDAVLQAWMAASADTNEGNIRGLPPMTTRDALKAVLTSLIFRITMHGVSRLNPSANPVQSFVATYPPCLQQASLPEPNEPLSTQQLLAFHPKTGTIGEMMTFYFTFVFSKPYVSFIPPKGVDADLFFPGGPADPRNAALIEFRKSIGSFIEAYLAACQGALAGLGGQAPPGGTDDGPFPQRYQWPRDIET